MNRWRGDGTRFISWSTTRRWEMEVRKLSHGGTCPDMEIVQDHGCCRRVESLHVRVNGAVSQRWLYNIRTLASC